MLGKYWLEPAKRLYIQNCPAVGVLSSRIRAIILQAWGILTLNIWGIFRDWRMSSSDPWCSRQASSSDQSSSVLPNRLYTE